MISKWSPRGFHVGSSSHQTSTRHLLHRLAQRPASSPVGLDITMVHRPVDARLLNNLIAHEKDYTKHFAALFPLSHTALASLSAYGAASPSANPYSTTSDSPAQVVAAIIDVLAGAEDALQRHLQAVEKWREQLASLKELEEDIGAIIHDREIL